MKCEICQQREAEQAIRQAVDGEVRELFVCGACARRGEAGAAAVNPLVELLFSAAFAVQGEAQAETTCAACGMTRAEFRKRSRLGCPACYEAFTAELGPQLRDMHRGDTHAGKVPGRARAAGERARLRQELETAVRAQRFEDAARLRDRLAALGQAGGGDATA